MSRSGKGGQTIPARLVCRCVGISSSRILSALRAGSRFAAGDLLACVARRTGAGMACGSCRAEILEVIADWRGDPVPVPVRTRHRLRCQSETELRIESCLRLGTPARDGAGALVRARLERVSGLEVTLSLRPDEPWLRIAISESLRTRVCGDLRISFSKS